MYSLKYLLVFLSFFIGLNSKAQSLPDNVKNKYLVNISGKWEYPPPELNSKIRTVSATILYLQENGEFFETFVELIDNPGRINPYVIGQGEARLASAGVWKIKNNRLITTRKSVFRTIRTYSKTREVTVEPLCNPSSLTYFFDAQGLRGSTGDQFEENRLLDSSNLQFDFNAAKSSNVICN